jgi:hypothetical protein
MRRALYGTNRERTAALDGWLWTDNPSPPIRAIGRQPPITQLNNVLGSYNWPPCRNADATRTRCA